MDSSHVIQRRHVIDKRKQAREVGELLTLLKMFL